MLMNGRIRGMLLAAVAASALCLPAAAVAGTPVGGSGAPDPVCTPSRPGGYDWVQQTSSGGTGVVSRPNGFDTSGQRLCISPVASGGPGFTVLNNLRYTGLWQAYPYTGYGCAYDLCSTGSVLPMQVKKLPSWTQTSWNWTGGNPAYSWNASYDIWFDHHDQISRGNDGTELMIWLRWNTSFAGMQLVHIGRAVLWFTHWRDCDPGSHICWNYVQFRFTRIVHGVRRLPLVPFIRFLEARRLMSPSWWLTSIHAGYEIVSGGKGLRTTFFNAHV